MFTYYILLLDIISFSSKLKRTLVSPGQGKGDGLRSDIATAATAARSVICLCLSLPSIPKPIRLLTKPAWNLVAAATPDAGGGEKQLALEAPPQPAREDYVQNAVKFLSHPEVRGSTVVYRHSFLQNKGLTNDEIDEAFRRVRVHNISRSACSSSDPQSPCLF